MMKKKLKISLSAATLLYSSLIIAETIELDSIAVSASPIHNHTTFDTPAAVDIINSDVIASKTTASLGEVLSDTPGVNNLSTGSQAGKPVIRGMTGERVKVLSNGNATEFQTYGIRHISNTDTFLADSIEVVRGAQGVLYGSDALGGVVNILSPKLLWAKEGETKLKGEILGEYHTNNKERAGGAKIQSAIGKLGVNIGIIKRKSDNINTPNVDNWEPGDPAGTKPRFSGELPYTNYESISAQMAIGYTDDYWDIALQHTYWQSFQNYLGHTSPPLFSAIPSAGQDLSNNETQLSGNIFIGEWIITPTISRTLNNREAATGVEYESMNDTNIDLDIEVDRVDAKIALTHPEIGIFEGEVGIEGYTKKQDVTKGHLVPNADQDGKAIYLFEEADIGKWITQFGLRYDSTKVNADVTQDGSKEFSAIGGSLGLVYKITPNFNIATNLTRGFRAPSIFELYADGIHGGIQAYQIGNANLNKEITLGGDLSLRYKDEKTKVSLTAYRTKIDNYIYLASTGNFRNKNTGNIVAQGTPGALPELTNRQTTAQIQGVEFFIETYLRDSTRLKGAFEIIDGKDIDNDTGLTMMPANNLTLALYQNIGTFKNMKNNILSLNMQAYDDKEVASSQEPFYHYNNMPFGSADTQGYVLWGISYESELNIMEQKANLMINVNNILDEEYRNFLDTYKGYSLGMGRNISFSLRIPFEL
ncbi:MAG: TonB-dependent receptor [Campylobacterota bacterium]|nr:TonB-dependent receptor [Campylobacterota bacterium]